jgi:hypothetical protein
VTWRNSIEREGTPARMSFVVFTFCLECACLRFAHLRCTFAPKGVPEGQNHGFKKMQEVVKGAGRQIACDQQTARSVERRPFAHVQLYMDRIVVFRRTEVEGTLLHVLSSCR